MFSQVQSYVFQVLCVKSTLGLMDVLHYTLSITALQRNFSTSLYLHLNLFRKTKNAMHTTHHGAKFLLVLNQLEVAQHSVHPTGGSLRVFKQFVWLEVGSGKMVLSRPTHQRVTQAVRQHASFFSGSVCVIIPS